MRWCNLLFAQTLLLSIIDFAFAAPVILQEHEVRVSVAKDRWLVIAADRTNAPPIPGSPDSGYWRELEPRTDGLPEPPLGLTANNPPTPPSAQASGDVPNLSNLGPSSPHGSIDLNRMPSPDKEVTDDTGSSHASNLAFPSVSHPLSAGQPHDIMDSNSKGLPEPSNPAPPIDSNVNDPTTSPSPTNQAPTDEPNRPNLSNPGPSPHGGIDLNRMPYPDEGVTDDIGNSHASNLAIPSVSRPLSPGQPHYIMDSNSKGLSEPSNPAPPIDSNVNDPTTSPSPTIQAPTDEPNRPNLSNSGPSLPHGSIESSRIPYQDEEWTSDSSGSHVSNLASTSLPSGSRPLSSEEPHFLDRLDANYRPMYKLTRLKFKPLSQITSPPSTPTHETPPDGSPLIESSPEMPQPSSSWAPSGSPNSKNSESSSWSSATEGSSPKPPPRAKRPRPEEEEVASVLSKIVKGRLKRRFSGRAPVL